MKIDLHLPSAALGAGASAIAILAMTSPLLSPMRIFDYSDVSFFSMGAGLTVLGAAALLARRPLTYIPSRSAQADEVAKRYPAARQQGSAPSTAKNPVEWIKDLRSRNDGAQVSTINDIQVLIDKELAAQVMHDVDPDIAEALKVAFVGYAQNRKGRFLQELAVSMEAAGSTGRRLDLDAYKAACIQMGYVEGSEVEVARSPFSTVELVRLLDESRKKGVVASAEFLWLKRTDRTLWYALNNLGRIEFHVEGAGIMAHYERQRRSGEKLMQPEVQDAVAGAMEFLESHGINPVLDTDPKP